MSSGIITQFGGLPKSGTPSKDEINAEINGARLASSTSKMPQLAFKQAKNTSHEHGWYDTKITLGWTRADQTAGVNGS